MAKPTDPDPELRQRALDSILADELRTRSRCECLTCGGAWLAQHRTAAGPLRCPCGSFDTLRYEVDPAA